MLNSKRNIVVVTSSRADYGLLYRLIKRLHASPQCNLKLVVTGTHLEEKFGYTYTEILQDGFTAHHTIKLNMQHDDDKHITDISGALLQKFGDYIANNRPDIVVCLGDRYEMLAMASAAMMHRVPIAHIHGGEITTGAIDDVIRHAITKMAHLHFVSAEAYKNNVMQLGEEPKHIFNVGSLGVENTKSGNLIAKDIVQKDISFSLNEPFMLITYHPQTVSRITVDEQISCLLQALQHSNFVHMCFLFTLPNADSGHNSISALIQEFVEQYKARACIVSSLGKDNYIALMHYAKVIVGNSSSAIIEAPSCHTPSVNIGDRQGGRLRAPSVIDCAIEQEAIANALTQALSPAHQHIAQNAINPYEGTSLPSATIADILLSIDISNILYKHFNVIQ